MHANIIKSLLNAKPPTIAGQVWMASNSRYVNENMPTAAFFALMEELGGLSDPCLKAIGGEGASLKIRRPLGCALAEALDTGAHQGLEYLRGMGEEELGAAISRGALKGHLHNPVLMGAEEAVNPTAPQETREGAFVYFTPICAAKASAGGLSFYLGGNGFLWGKDGVIMQEADGDVAALGAAAETVPYSPVDGEFSTALPFGVVGIDMGGRAYMNGKPSTMKALRKRIEDGVEEMRHDPALIEACDAFLRVAEGFDGLCCMENVTGMRYGANARAAYFMELETGCAVYIPDMYVFEIHPTVGAGCAAFDLYTGGAMAGRYSGPIAEECKAMEEAAAMQAEKEKENEALRAQLHAAEDGIAMSESGSPARAAYENIKKRILKFL